MIAHVWSGPGDSLTLDPASGVRGDEVVATRYNDFANLHWLGNKPASTFQFSSAAESGWWVCVEAYAKLNVPGQKDGVCRLWIDGRLEAERLNLDWRGSYKGHAINAVFLEAYWNQGSPVSQTRWLDNFVISTKPIGPVVCSANPVLIKTPYRGSGKLAAWRRRSPPTWRVSRWYGSPSRSGKVIGSRSTPRRGRSSRRWKARRSSPQGRPTTVACDNRWMAAAGRRGVRGTRASP